MRTIVPRVRDRVLYSCSLHASVIAPYADNGDSHLLLRTIFMVVCYLCPTSLATPDPLCCIVWGRYNFYILYCGFKCRGLDTQLPTIMAFANQWLKIPARDTRGFLYCIVKIGLFFGLLMGLFTRVGGMGFLPPTLPRGSFFGHFCFLLYLCFIVRVAFLVALSTQD